MRELGIERVLTNDPDIGEARLTNAGYDIAKFVRAELSVPQSGIRAARLCHCTGVEGARGDLIPQCVKTRCYEIASHPSDARNDNLFFCGLANVDTIKEALIIQSTGGVAQPGEHLLCKQEVGGSSPLASIITPHRYVVSAWGPRIKCSFSRKREKIAT